MVGGYGYLSVYDYNQNYLLLDNITDFLNYTIPLYCTQDYLFVATLNQELYVLKRGTSPSPTPDDGIPDAFVIVAIAFASLIVLGCFILICIKKGLGITAYKFLKRCFKKKDAYDGSLYTDSSDFGR